MVKHQWEFTEHMAQPGAGECILGVTGYAHRNVDALVEFISRLVSIYLEHLDDRRANVSVRGAERWNEPDAPPMNFRSAERKGRLRDFTRMTACEWQQASGFELLTSASVHAAKQFEGYVRLSNLTQGVNESHERIMSATLGPATVKRLKKPSQLVAWAEDMVDLIDSTGCCYLATIDCDTAEELDHGHYFGMFPGGNYARTPRKLEYLDWESCGEAARLSRVRGPCWGYYLPSPHVERLDRVIKAEGGKDFMTEFLKPREEAEESTQRARRHKSGAISISMSNNPLDWIAPGCPDYRCDGCMLNLVWVWRRMRAAGMV